MPKQKLSPHRVRYAVVGLGHITQVAALPAFKALKHNSELVALISGDSKKLRKVGKLYKVKRLGGYDELEAIIEEEKIDAVFIGTPNTLHEEHSIRAMRAGAHVLCEKPLSVSSESCQRMMETARGEGKQLMTAYRLHFDPTYLEVMQAIKKGDIGEPSVFTSTFSYQIKDDNIRLKKDLAGGALMDIGIYCINAARGVFREEPSSVFASLTQPDARFEEVDGSVSATLYFTQNKIAQFTASFAMHERGWFEVVGSKGVVRAEPAYEYATKIAYKIEGKRKRINKGKKYDQFAGELDHFSDSILSGKDVQSDAGEGLADMLVIEAIQRSAKSGKIEKVGKPSRETPDYPRKEDSRKFNGHDEPTLVDVESAST